MSDYLVVWSGAMKASLPGLGGIERKASYLAQTGHQQKRGAVIRTICACGRDMVLRAQSRHTTCGFCRGISVAKPKTVLAPCGCGRRVRRANRHTQRCDRCLAAGRSVRRQAALSPSGECG